MKKSTSLNSPAPEFLSGDDILGKTVIDADGAIIGVSNQLLIDKETYDFVGIAIDKGFLRKGLLIGKEHISKVTKHALFLKIVPSLLIKDKKVFNNQGEFVGKVLDVQLSKGNKVQYIFCRNTKIPAKEIKSIGDNVLLK